MPKQPFFPNRRDLLSLISAGTISAMLPAKVYAQTRARILVIGGGFGGATAARELKAYMPNAQITLIESTPVYTACPFSNLVIGGLRDLSAQRFSYDSLSASGVNVIFDTATDVDTTTQTVSLSSGTSLSYDRLILSPGISIRWNPIEGYDEEASAIMPHAWKAGPQTTLLRQQLEALDDGEDIILTAPPAPFRCPPGPYERASLIAAYLKSHKPRSKLIILDAKDQFSKMPLFLEAWAEHYPDHLEWRGASDDGRVSRVTASTRTVHTDFEDLSAGVVNVIPPQKAGTIAERAGVTDATGWCPIDAVSFESKLVAGVHVIGDATIAAPMPKSAFSANLQAKVCALAVAELMSGHSPSATTLANTCYSYITEDQAVSIVGVYHNENGTLSSVPDAGGISPLAADAGIRQLEAIQAASWFETITAEAFG